MTHSCFHHDRSSFDKAVTISTSFSAFSVLIQQFTRSCGCTAVCLVQMFCIYCCMWLLAVTHFWFVFISQELDERLGWLTNLIGGTGNQLDQLYSCVLHVLYMIVGMITTSFTGAPTSTRALLLILVPGNLAVTYHHGDSAALNFPTMTALIFVSTAGI